MTAAKAAVASGLFLFLAPGFVAGLVPWWLCRWRFDPPLLGLWVLRVCGPALIAAATAGLIDSIARFAIHGRGTPAPALPTESLVIDGLYRYVRNPMYVAVIWLILGQGLLFGNIRVIVYGVFVWMLLHAFVWLYEEPILKAKYGLEYDAYRRRVPRWIPRLKLPSSG